jgi:hypothetical protein
MPNARGFDVSPSIPEVPHYAAQPKTEASAGLPLLVNEASMRL